MKAISLKDSEMLVTCITAGGGIYTSEHFRFNSETDTIPAVREREKHMVADANGFDPHCIIRTRFRRVLSDDNVYISEHAFRRMKERAGFSRSTGLRMAARAYERGTAITPSTAALRQWFETKNLMYKGSTYYMTFIKYGEFLYVYKNTVLVTMYPFDEKHIYDHSDRDYRHNKRLVNKAQVSRFTEQTIMLCMDDYYEEVS